MAYELIFPKKKNDSYLNKAGRVIGGGLTRAGENALLGAGVAINPVGAFNQSISNQFIPQNNTLPSLSETYFKPKNKGEDYAQHLISALASTGAMGGLSTAGKKIGEKAISLGKSSAGTVGNIITSDIVKSGAQAAGLPEPVALALGAAAPGAIHSLRNVKQPLQNIKSEADKKALDIKRLRTDLESKKNDLRNALDLEKYKKDLDIQKKELYKQSRNNPKAITNQRELRKELVKGLELEHKYTFNKSENNRKNIEGGLNKFRTDKKNIDSSIHKPQKYSNYDLLKDLKSPKGEIDLNRNIILNDLFPKKDFFNKDGTIDTKKLSKLYKEDIKLNELFDFNKNLNAINYATRGKTSPAMKNIERVLHKGVDKAAKNHPEQVSSFKQANEIHALQSLKDPKNKKLLEYAEKRLPKEVGSLRKADEIESLLSIKDKDKTLWEYATKNHPEEVEAFHKSAEIEKLLTGDKPEDLKGFEKALYWIFKVSKYLGIGKLIEKGYLTRQSFKNAAPETKQFIVDNVIDKIKENPGIFQQEIKKLNQIVDKKEENKKGKFELIF